MLYNYLTINGKTLKIGIYSPFYEKISPDLIEFQKKVFDKFNINLNQVYNTLRHGDFLTNISKSEDVDYLMFFDIDAIPFKPNFLEILIKRVFNKKVILGIEQRANHIPNSEIYAGPACFLISKETYNFLGQPSYSNCKVGDVAQYLTILSKEKGVEVDFLKFKNCIKPRWKLDENRKFGTGSNYEDIIFHNFLSRNQSVEDKQIFIDMCLRVIADADK